MVRLFRMDCEMGKIKYILITAVIFLIAGCGVNEEQIEPEDSFESGMDIHESDFMEAADLHSEEFQEDHGIEMKISCNILYDFSPLDSSFDKTFSRGPYLQSVFKDSAVVVWRDFKEEPVEGCVKYSYGGNDFEKCALPDYSGQYEVTLEDLPADSEIAYFAFSGEEATIPFTFRTAPDETSAARLLVIADGHNNPVTLPMIAEAALSDGVDLAVHVGDAVAEPEEILWDQFLDGLRALIHRVPLWTALGNHEARNPTYFHAFVLPGAAPPPQEEIYYSVRRGIVWMAMLELPEFFITAETEIEMPQITWLKERLAGDEAQSARWRLLFIHEPPWSLGWGECEGYHGEESLRKVLIPIAKEFGVSAIFSGHMHGYERGEVDGVALVVAGGAGGSLDIPCPPPEGFPQPWHSVYTHHRVIVDALCDALVIEAKDLDGNIIDHFEIPFPDPMD